MQLNRPEKHRVKGLLRYVVNGKFQTRTALETGPSFGIALSGHGLSQWYLVPTKRCHGVIRNRSNYLKFRLIADMHIPQRRG